MRLQYSALPLLLLGLLGALPAHGTEESNTDLFMVYVRNSSFPDIDGKVSYFFGISACLSYRCTRVVRSTYGLWPWHVLTFLKKENDTHSRGPCIRFLRSIRPSSFVPRRSVHQGQRTHPGPYQPASQRPRDGRQPKLRNVRKKNPPSSLFELPFAHNLEN